MIAITTDLVVFVGIPILAAIAHAFTCPKCWRPNYGGVCPKCLDDASRTLQHGSAHKEARRVAIAGQATGAVEHSSRILIIAITLALASAIVGCGT